MPCIPAQGSVGASGDLAPLAHLAAVLIGEGEARVRRRSCTRRRALSGRGRCARSCSAPKEGLALLNGTQVSTALALAGCSRPSARWPAALVAGALSVDACLGSDTPFDARIHALRAHPGQVDAARTSARPARRQRDPRLASSTATACRIPTACAASRR